MERQAIILKQRGKKVALLDATKGRIDAFISYHRYRDSLSPGTVISYKDFELKNKMLWIRNPCLEKVPLQWGREDIILLHSLLELCYLFIPIGSGFGERSYTFVYSLYDLIVCKLLSQHRKIIVSRLLLVLGVYPEEQKFRKLFYLLSEVPIDNTAITDLELSDEKILNDLIRWCIEDHPQRQWFKAVPFFLKSEE